MYQQQHKHAKAANSTAARGQAPGKGKEARLHQLVGATDTAEEPSIQILSDAMHTAKQVQR